MTQLPMDDTCVTCGWWHCQRFWIWRLSKQWTISHFIIPFMLIDSFYRCHAQEGKWCRWPDNPSHPHLEVLPLINMAMHHLVNQHHTQTKTAFTSFHLKLEDYREADKDSREVVHGKSVPQECVNSNSKTSKSAGPVIMTNSLTEALTGLGGPSRKSASRCSKVSSVTPSTGMLSIHFSHGLSDHFHSLQVAIQPQTDVLRHSQMTSQRWWSTRHQPPEDTVCHPARLCTPISGFNCWSGTSSNIHRGSSTITNPLCMLNTYLAHPHMVLHSNNLVEAPHTPPGWWQLFPLMLGTSNPILQVTCCCITFRSAHCRKLWIECWKSSSLPLPLLPSICAVGSLPGSAILATSSPGLLSPYGQFTPPGLYLKVPQPPTDKDNAVGAQPLP